MMQGHEIANERLVIRERGRPHCYSEEKVFLELVNIGIPSNIQLDAMLFLIKDPSKMRAFFCVPASELRRQILLKMMYVKNLRGCLDFGVSITHHSIFNTYHSKMVGPT